MKITFIFSPLFQAHLLHSFYRHICETPVTEQAFIEQLHELHHKIDFAKQQSFKGALSVNDVENDLEKLKVKVLYHRSAIHLPKVNSALFTVYFT